MSIKLTENSAKEFKKIFGESEMPDDACVRITIRGKNEGLFFYRIGIQDRPNQKDSVYESCNVKVCCDPKSDDLLDGLTIDFVDKPLSEGGGFKFESKKNGKTEKSGELDS